MGAVGHEQDLVGDAAAEWLHGDAGRAGHETARLQVRRHLAGRDERRVGDPEPGRRVRRDDELAAVERDL